MAMSPTQRQDDVSRCMDILRFWHKVEFFIPFDLEQQVFDAVDASWSVRSLSAAALRAADAHTLWEPVLPADRELTGFELYLGVFDKSELARVTGQVVAEALSPVQRVEQGERAELEGSTCFARLKLNACGEPLFDEVSLSTVPWALGLIQARGLAALEVDAFLAGAEALKQDLRGFRAVRGAGEPVVAPLEPGQAPADAPRPLSVPELLALIDLLGDWADFRPRRTDPQAPLVVVRATSVEARARPPAVQGGSVSTPRAEVQGLDEEEAAGREERGIDILNSFYAKDIERALLSLQRGDACPVLKAYLTPLADEARIDLYQPAGREYIAAALQPRRLNRGHWFDESKQAMSLMQQFAVHSALGQGGAAGPLFSVNGPPGTGKTTLLRDLIADNITRRARVLSRFQYAGDAFLPLRSKVLFEGAEACDIALLREEVTGFEMLVASTNNAAVENISRDLPKARSLGAGEWRDGQGTPLVGYLQPLAHKLAARTAKGDYASLKADELPWGLISRALGRWDNRQGFLKGLVEPGCRVGEQPPKGFDPERHQSFWEWRNRYQGPKFIAAKQLFLQADAAVAERLEGLARYAALSGELAGQTAQSFSAAERLREHESRETLAAAQASCRQAGQACAFLAARLQNLREEADLIERGRPAAWTRWIQRSVHQRYRADLAANHQAQRHCLQAQRRAESEFDDAELLLQQASDAHVEAQAELSVRQALWRDRQRELAQGRSEFPQAARPSASDELEQHEWQVGGLWRDERLNGLRSELFAAALVLQEAWLADVSGKGGGFAQNVIAFSRMLSGKRLVHASQALPVWQSLFMVVPVVSSTFASIANQFRDLGPDTLGWLFIDEAGQAVPQAAVGALWRARRAVVVGDPMQIEPVFTVPIQLIEAIARSSRLPPFDDVSPHRVSVQTLADAANPLGTRIRAKGAWIGSPLRVHRRCVEPMFGVANTIAYDGKMIFFDASDPQRRLPSVDSLDLGSSAWVDVAGAAVHKQVVPAQVHLVQQALVALYLRTGELPPLYVVSPFKRVKAELIASIADTERWRAYAGPDASLPSRTRLHEWCRERVGTVHTFQGKEESGVWMVLGCDQDTLPAAQWAAAKPNLLNVALTRARHRFFMIGDAGLWGTLSHFDAARRALPVIGGPEFLERMHAVKSPGSRRALKSEA